MITISKYKKGHSRMSKSSDNQESKGTGPLLVDEEALEDNDCEEFCPRTGLAHYPTVRDQVRRLKGLRS